jgi:thiol-disulfide isomerase/thioredoxin
MKYLLLIGILAAIGPTGSVRAQNKQGWVLLQGTVKNFNNQVEVEDMSEMKSLVLSDPQHFFVPDAEGHFKIRFRLASPNYFRLGRNILYLTPGDTLNIFADQKDGRLASFNGSHSHENEYLRETPYPKAGSFLEAGRNIRSTIDSTVRIVLSEAAKRTASLQSYKGLEKTFVQLETGRIRADLLNSFSAINSYYPYVRKLSKEATVAFHAGFEEAIKPYWDQYSENFIDPGFLKLVVYRDIAEELVKRATSNTAGVQQIKDWMAADELAAGLKNASEREAKLGFTAKIAAVKNNRYRTALEQTLKGVLQLSNGDLAVDFTAFDETNASKKLSSLKGNLIYVDLWATWCGPCMEEMPAYEKLKESYKDNKNIRFISLSIDDDQQAWKQSLQKRNASGNQWIINRTKLEAYNIIGVPRSILVDQDFHIVEMNAALPSSKQIHETIDGLLK